MDFYTIVITVAIVFLIIILTILGIFLSNKTTKQVYPPSKNNCPDYWTYVADGSNNLCKINSQNAGSLMDASGVFLLTNVPGVNTSLNSINFSDAGFVSKYGGTQVCSLNKWANENKIAWDGITNYNGC